jgi:DNA-binding transcriptional regulator YhcF (GntR family)
MLGIISADLAPGQKLPSTRELARRFQIHANTVIAAYRELSERDWIELRQGSGAYVREKAVKNNGSGNEKFALDQMTIAFLEQARAGGFSIQEIKSNVRFWLNLQPPDHIVVIESDETLREILMAEIQEATAWQVQGISVEECSDAKKLSGALPVALYSRADTIRQVLPENTNCHLLHLNSVPAAIKGRQKPENEALIAVVSGWAGFLRWSHAILVAIGIEEDVLSLRVTTERGWQRGLHECAFVIADVVTAKEIPAESETRVFRLIAENSLQEIREFMPKN